MSIVLNGTTGITTPALDSVAKFSSADMPAGNVLQVVQGLAETPVTVSVAAYTDVGLSASITPISTTSKILALCTVFGYGGGNGAGYGIRLMRDLTEIWNPSPSDVTGPFYCFVGTGGGIWDATTLKYLDSPNTTSELVYKIQGRPYTATLPISFNYADGKSSLILMEIAA
jgi:hypothetical protein